MDLLEVEAPGEERLHSGNEIKNLHLRKKPNESLRVKFYLTILSPDNKNDLYLKK